MDDASIVASLVEGDSAALAEAYRSYADRLFTYCVSMLRDRDAAADAVHDTFVVAAERVGQLRDPGRLRPWLYAIARNECLRAIRDLGRSAVLDEHHLDEVGSMTDETSEIGADLREAELRHLVWAAADGLNPREREVLELSVRHQLDGAELAAAIGVPPNHAHALLSKARQQLERALAALIVARTGRRDCATLSDLLTGWDGAMSVLLRKRVARHIESCSTCMERKRRDVSATALLGATPLLAAPPALRDRVLGGLGDIALVAEHQAIANRAGRLGQGGFPTPLDRPPTSFAWQAPAVAAAAAAVFLLSGVMLLSDTQDTSANIAQSPPPATLSLLPSPASTPSTEPAAPSTSATQDPPDPSTASTPGTSSDPGTSDPPSPEPPPNDLLSIHCGDPDADCKEYLVAGERLGVVDLTTESDAEISVSIAEDVPWLYFTTLPIAVYPNVPAQVQFGIRDAPACSWSVPVTFEVIGANHSEALLVKGGKPCIRG